MAKLSDVGFLTATIAEADRLLSASMHPLMRIGFEGHRAELKKELEQASKLTSRARSILYFDGAPVVGHSVDAQFASRALAGYEDLVEKLAAVRSHGALHSSGPIPGREVSRLHISNAVHGSFGFELEEVAPGDLFDPSALAEAVEDASQLISAAARDDDAFIEALPEAGAERVRGSLRSFLSTIAEAGATVRVVSQKNQAHLKKVDVELAVERVTSTTVTMRMEENVPGVFLGVLMESGRFEHRREGGTTISGRSSRDADWHGWNALVEKHCIAVVEVESITRGLKVRNKYTLLALRSRS